jgi:hypothetical protein
MKMDREVIQLFFHEIAGTTDKSKLWLFSTHLYP